MALRCLLQVYLGLYLSSIVSGFVEDLQRVNQVLISPEYDKTERPFFTKDKPVTVSVDIAINRLSSVNEISMEYTIDVYLRQRWIDDRLANIGLSKMTIITYDFHRLWIPDIVFVNFKSGFFHDITQANRALRLEPNGEIMYSQRLSLTLGCDMKLQSFPWDTQICLIAIESFTYLESEVQIIWNPNKAGVETVTDDLHLPEFDYVGATYKNFTYVYDNVFPFTRIVGELILRRESGYYMIQSYIPTMLIVILSWVSFWIDIRSIPARVTVGLLTVLTINTLSSGTNTQMPKVSYVKAIDVWYSGCLGFVFGALIEYAIVNVLARSDVKLRGLNKFKESEKKKVYEQGSPGKEESKLPSSSASGPSVGAKVSPEGAPCATSRVRRLFSSTEPAVLVDYLSRFLFPIAFTIFNIVYWVYYLGSN